MRYTPPPSSELAEWEANKSLSVQTRRQLEEQFGHIEAIVEVVKTALEEENQTYQYTSEKVSETLFEAEAKKRRCSGNLSDTDEARYSQYTQGYLDNVLGIFMSQDKSLLKEIERATGSKINGRLLSYPSRSLLDG